LSLFSSLSFDAPAKGHEGTASGGRLRHGLGAGEASLQSGGFFAEADQRDAGRRGSVG
jgi:hypothetical protein